MKVQRSVGDDVDGSNSLETVRIYFYALKDPETLAIRYIGQTVNPDNRYRNHIYGAKKNNKTHKERWIIQLLRKNLMPIFVILWEEVMTANAANDFETYMIQYYKDIGYNLTNMEDRGRNNPIIETTKVYQFSMDGKFIASFSSVREASRATGVCYKRISANINHRQKTAGGFVWKLDEDMI